MSPCGRISLGSFLFFSFGTDGIMGCRDGTVTRSEALDFLTHSIFSFFDKLSKEIDLRRHIEQAIWVSSVACRVGASAPRAMGQELGFFSFLFTVIFSV